MDGLPARWEALERVRTVAKTWKSCAAKAMARAEPIPPALQPVMSTVFGAMAWNGGSRVGGGVGDPEGRLGSVLVEVRDLRGSEC